NTYNINPEKLEDFNEFFHKFIYPYYLSCGARLLGRWVNASKTEILAIWEYNSMEEYREIEREIMSSNFQKVANIRRKELGALYIKSHQELLTSTGHYKNN
ncbi:NIPSNAP family protein, partial [Rossellomorea vietnamensis]|uniref:NIPSNAP family protein n=1 Tax=Rossellomorea vietnamensis TaxID=218284 RepID=UPI000A883A49